MNVSTLVKILIALFLAGFLWLIITNIEAPKTVENVVQPREQLRDELLGIAEDVTINVGDISIQAETQETYRNGEVHYQNFTMTQKNKKRELTITGKTAQTKSEGTEISFLVLNGSLVVDTTDGLHLETESLNYESNKERIFTQDETVFQLNELRGRCNKFVFELESKRLEMRGDVDARYLMAGEKGKKKRRIEIRGREVIYDQTEHILHINKRGVISEGGSFIRGDSILADLTEDNSQFVRMTVERARTRGMPDFGGEEENPEETVDENQTEEINAENEQKGDASFSHHASGIKNIEADSMLMEFTTGDNNLLRKVTAIGNASMDITPTGRIINTGNAEHKKITGEQIIAQVDTELGGLKALSVNSQESLSRMEQRPLFADPAKYKDENLPRKDQPRYTTAQKINMTINPENNLIASMILQRDVKIEQGDLVVTADNCNYQASAGTMVLSGSPVLEDSVKRVSGDSMTISTLIDDLAATGNVSSQFFKVEENASSDARSVFAIGKEGGETLIKAASLRLDYSNNILRYRNGVTINQGNTVIRSEKLDIHQVEERLIAIGDVSADLTYENIASDRSQEEQKGKKKSKGVFLSGGYLEINKDQRFVRVRNKAKAVQGNMTISAEEVGYSLDEEDRIIKSTARRSVQIDLSGPMIEGDLAVIDPAKELLTVTGKLVTFIDPAGMSGEKYRKIEFDMNTEAMKFYGRGNEPISTKVLGTEESSR